MLANKRLRSSAPVTGAAAAATLSGALVLFDVEDVGGRGDARALTPVLEGSPQTLFVSTRPCTNNRNLPNNSIAEALNAVRAFREPDSILDFFVVSTTLLACADGGRGRR